jgi:hypothetical protein
MTVIEAKASRLTPLHPHFPCRQELRMQLLINYELMIF